MKIITRTLSLLIITFICNTSIANINDSLLKEINSRPNSPEGYENILNKLEDKRFLKAFKKAIVLESNDQFKESIVHLKIVQEAFPDAPYLIWRMSREYWRYAENLDINDKSNRLINFKLGLDWAEKGIALD